MTDVSLISSADILRSWFEWDLEESPSKLVWMIETRLQTNPLGEDFDSERLSDLLDAIQSAIDTQELGIQKFAQTQMPGQKNQSARENYAFTLPLIHRAIQDVEKLMDDFLEFHEAIRPKDAGTP